MAQPRHQRRTITGNPFGEFRLEANEATRLRLEQIIRKGGPMPEGTRVIGAAIVEVEGYRGPRELRAISSKATDGLGHEAPTAHAQTPTTRTLSVARSIGGASIRREFPFSHINDAEIKLFEEITANLPANARGRISFLTMRSREGGNILEPIPACSSCTNAALQLAGNFRGVQVGSYAATRPVAVLDLGLPPAAGARLASPGGRAGTPPAQPAPPKAPAAPKAPPKAPAAPKAPSLPETPPAATTAPTVKPPSAWKAGLKAGGKVLVWALIFAGLEYLVRRRLDKELDESIDKARDGAMPWAQRLKREDPSKPVYMRVMVRAEEYSRYVPLLGWMPETPKLHMIQIAMVREEIDPPVVENQDDRFNIWRPGVATTVTYTELMVP